MPRTKHLLAPLTFKDADSGSVVARFSVFDVEDRDGDIVRRSAFQDGQQVPMVWSHDWSVPVGKGVVRVLEDYAAFEGQFFGTTAGQEARHTVREMGELQQWSWGFRVTDTQPNEDIKGYDITGAEVFEVSPVLVGANAETATLAVKGASDNDDPLVALWKRLANEAAAAVEVATAGDDVQDALKALYERLEEISKEYVSEPSPEEIEAREQLEQERLAFELAVIGDN